jgi:demethylmenaquinone methyltransferase/2-methoxy-6-polyprenyl-1,4-benzoquinol methylase
MNVYYARRAPQHDALMSYTSNVAFEHLLGRVISDFEPYVLGKDVLEIACGTGNWTQVLSKRARSVLATDINENVLEIAQAKSYPRDNVTFELMDAYTTPDPIRTYEALVAVDWWSHIPVALIPEFVTNVRQSLRPGGAAVFVDMLRKEALDRMYSHHDEDSNRIEHRSVADGQEFFVVKNFPTEAQMCDHFKNFKSPIFYRTYADLERWTSVVTL